MNQVISHSGILVVKCYRIIGKGMSFAVILLIVLLKHYLAFLLGVIENFI